jgi:anti-sigma factor RsiW
MPDRSEPLPPLDAPEHSDAWAFAYLDGTLSEAERASFQEHLKSHEACREEVETMRVALPAFVRVLMEDGPPRSNDEYVAMVRAAEAKVGANGEKQAARPPERARKMRRPLWAFGAGFAALAAAAASVAIVLDPFSAGLEPELIAKVASAPIAEAPGQPLPPWPVKLEVATAIRFGRMEVHFSRLATDLYAAVVLVDSKNHQWLAQSGTGSCAPNCRELALRVALDRLAPGAFQVMVLVSAQPITDDGLRQWLPQAEQVAPRWLGVRAYAVARVAR